MKHLKWLLTLFIVLMMSLPLLVTAQENSAFATNTPQRQDHAVVDSTNMPQGPVNSLLFSTNTPFAEPPTATASPTITPTATFTATPTITPTASPTLAPPASLSEPAECAYVEGQSTSAACIAFMNAHPAPDVKEIRLDVDTLNQYSFWRVGPEAVSTYSEPGGTPTGQIPQGFNFVNVVSQLDGWIQSEDGQWINTNNAQYVETSHFTGVLIPENWTLAFGWVLDTTGIYASSFPGGEADPSTGLVPLHYQRFNIFAEFVDNEGWLWYLVGPNQWVKQVYMTVIQPVERPPEIMGRWVAVDLFEQSLVAYEGNTPIFATLVSTGLSGTETNEGIFEIWARLERDAMSGATGAPNAYALQSVPWVQYFDSDISLHGTYWHDTFGYRHSRGCVNLSISDASWVFNFFNPLADSGQPVYVYVHSSGEYRG